MQSPYGTEEATTTAANAYHYVSNDPLNFTDPLGLCRTTDVFFDTSTHVDSEDAFVVDGPKGGLTFDECNEHPDVLCLPQNFDSSLGEFGVAPVRCGPHDYSGCVLANPNGSCWGSSIDDRALDLVSTAWALNRLRRNSNYTQLGLTLAAGLGGQCHSRSGFIQECMVPDHPFRGPQVTIGNVVLNRERTQMDAALLAHETKHADQWAILGRAFLPIYLAAEFAGGRGGCTNVFEMWADLQDGNYTNC